MKKRAIVLGCGMIGETMARDLAGDEGFDVTVADLTVERLDCVRDDARITRLELDVSDSRAVTEAVSGFDVVLGALPSRFGFETLRTIIRTGGRYCDITFMPEDALELNGLAKEHGATCIVDCGVSPGMSNVLVALGRSQLERADRARVYVGGLPKERRWPFQYKAPFAPGDVIEEYTRPARLIEHGRIVEKEALTEPELIDAPRVGTLEGFNTDGLRSLLQTSDIPDLVEKTLRYPGHAELMRVLRRMGLFDTTPVQVDGVSVVPRSLTGTLLFPQWRLQPGEAEFTYLRVDVEGTRSGEPTCLRYEIYDESDGRGPSSMARTTAYPCTIVARMLAEGVVAEPGVHAPEYLASREGVVPSLLAQLRERGVDVIETTCGE